MFKKVSSKVDFPQLERETLKYWQKNKILEKYLARNKDSKEKFKFLDGPITANNPMGVHHAWGRTYKDLWQRFFNMLGKRQRFQNGFDEQGLWVEVEVEKDLGLKTKKDIENLVPGNTFESIAKFVNLCKERVKKYSAVQAEQSKRLGYFMDWENSYHTSSDQNNYAIWNYLKTVHEKGWLYKGRDTVPWCPRCGTAISQHEILTEEYQEITHKAVYVRYPIIGKKNTYLLVWTTTPWTLPGNVSTAVNPELKYVEIDWVVGAPIGVPMGNYIVSDNLSERIFKDLDKEEVIRTFSGKELIGLEYATPFDDLERVKNAKKEGNFHKVIASKDLVTAEEGTGLVHIAPGQGEEDFKLGREQDIPTIELIDEGANYINGLGEFSGKNAKDHPELILDYLEKYENGKFFFKVEDYKHRYPTCWRCKTELVWRVVDEWYIAMDKPSKSKVKSQNSKVEKKTYREMMKEVIKDVKWIPSWGYERELDWLNNMHDWLISKKRYWGLALPIWECNKCGNFELVGSKEELNEKAVSGWKEFEGNSPHRPWIDQVKIKCSKCGEVVSRIPDVGNPWLDAGIVPFSTLNYFEDKDYWRKWFPADFITEAFPGQFKNWFYSLIAMSTALEATTPFKTLLGHGQVKDEKGEEMHKSKGNAIEFNESADKIGVDVMRWLYLRTKPEHNVNFGYHVAEEIKRLFLLRLWNVYVFFVTYANIDEWNPTNKKFKPTNVLDRWVFSRMKGNIEHVTEALNGLGEKKRFDAADAIGNAEIFVDDLSNWYVRRIRDRVGPNVPDGEDKKDAYETLWVVLKSYSKTLAPMVPFISEEIYTNLTGELSVHLVNWPSGDEFFKDTKLEEEMNLAREIVEAAHSKRKEKAIKVRQPLALLTYPKQKLDTEVEKVIAAEVNVKEVRFDPKQKEGVRLDDRITEELKEEGEARDLIRAVQEKRKEASVEFSDEVTVYAPLPSRKDLVDLVKKETLAKKLIQSNEIKVEKD